MSDSMKYVLSLLVLIMSSVSMAAPPAPPAEDPVCANLRTQLAVNGDQIAQEEEYLEQLKAELKATEADLKRTEDEFNQVTDWIIALSLTGRAIPPETYALYVRLFDERGRLQSLILAIKDLITATEGTLAILRVERDALITLLIQSGC